MNKKKTRILTLLGSLVVLLVIFILTINQTDKLAPNNKVVNIKKETISSISVKDQNFTTTLQRKNNQWVSQDNVAIDQSKVDEILSRILTIEKGEVLSSNLEKHSLFNIGSSIIEIQSGKTKIQLYVGKEIELKKIAIRMNSEKEIYSTDTNLLDVFGKDYFILKITPTPPIIN